MLLQRFWEGVHFLMWSWKDSKWFIEHSVSFSTDSLHVIAGVLIFCAAALLLKRPISSWRPWFVVFILICLNELSDIAVDQWPQRGMQFGESTRDFLLTMFLPTVLLLAARYLPQIYDRPPADSNADSSEA